MSRESGGALQALRAYAQMQRGNLGGHHVKAWLSNGLDELRQAVQPAIATQVGPGPATAYGVPTQGQLTTRREGKAHEMDRE